MARAVMQDMRRSVKQQHGLASVASLHAGMVTVVQRFRSDLALAQVHEVIRADDDDPALAACLQLSLAGPARSPQRRRR